MKYKLIEQLGLDVTKVYIKDSLRDSTTSTQCDVVFAIELEKLLSEAVVVYSHTDIWSQTQDGQDKELDTHQALLIGVQKIKRECVKHQPITYASQGFYEIDLSDVKCKHCGVPLKAEWKPASEGNE